MGPFRYAWRQLRRTPGFTVTAVVTLALGIGMPTAFFGIVNAVVLKPLPGADLSGLVLMQWNNRAPVSLSGVQGLIASPPAGVDAVAASGTLLPVRLQIPGRVQFTRPEFVSGHYASLLRLSPQRGRWLNASDDVSAAPVVVIGDRLWREWFGGRDDAVGASLRLTIGSESSGGDHPTQAFTIVGVARPEFRGLRGRTSLTEIWTSVAAASWLLPDQARDKWMRFLFLTPLARLESPSHLAAARESVDVRLQFQEALQQSATRRPTVVLSNAGAALRGDNFVPLAASVLGLALLILLAASANVASMLYARGAQRAAEFGVRLALGGSRRDIAALLAAEISVLTGFAVLMGFALSIAVTGAFASAFPFLLGGRYADMTLDLAPDVRVGMFAVFAGVLAAVFIGGLTMWRLSRQPLSSTVVSGGAAGMTPRRHRLRNVLVAVQVTVSVVLVMAAGLSWEEMRKTLNRRGLVGRTVQYDTSQIAAIQIDLRHHGYTDGRASAFLDQVVVATRASAGIGGVALADIIPGGPRPACSPGALSEKCNTTMFAADNGRGEPSPVRRVNASFARVSPELLDTLGLGIRRGRKFSPLDVDGAPPVAVVGARTAAALWPGQDPIGQRMIFGARDWLTVIGVVDDAIGADGEAPLVDAHFVFVPLAQHFEHAMPIHIVVRTPTPAGIEAAQSQIRLRDTEVAILSAGFIEDEVLSWLKPEQAATSLLVSLGVLSLAISMLGVYGVIAYFVSTRTREFGIRLALGASRGGVVKLVLDHAVHLTLIGLLVGVFIVSVASRVIQSRRFDFMPNEIETWIAVPVLILIAGIAAGVVPAFRAARVSPNVALKEL